MKQLKRHAASVLILMTGAMVAYGPPEDLIQLSNPWRCHPCNHNTEEPPGGCPHRRPINKGMCWTNGGQGVNLCPGQSEAACGSTNQFYDVKDFFLAEADNTSTSCWTESSGIPTPQYTRWAAHTYITSPPGQCYRTVQCEWNSNQCIIKPNSEGPWYMLPERRSNPCSTCQ